MELSDYVRIIRMRWVLIVSTVAVAVGAAALTTVLATAQYTSSARLFVSATVNNAGESYTGSPLTTERVNSYADLATGRELATRVVEELDLDLSPATLSAMIDPSVVPQTVVLQLSVTDADPERAQRLADAVSRELAVYIAELETPPGAEQPILKATVVDPATLPADPTSPNAVRNLGLAAVLGLLLGLGIAVLREVLDTSVRRSSDAEEASGTPVLATVEFDASTHEQPLITDASSGTPRHEALRVLRTNLQFVDAAQGPSVFVVTSATSGEGKSTIAVNLAVAMAQAGKSTLLIDANLRRPGVGLILGLNGRQGLSTVLAEQSGAGSAIEQVAVAGSSIAVLASGPVPPNPAELLEGSALTEVLRHARETYDVTIIDSPPLLPVADAAILASRSSGAILVVRSGSTTRDHVRSARERLDAVDARTLGVVLNAVRPDGRDESPDSVYASRVS